MSILLSTTKKRNAGASSNRNHMTGDIIPSLVAFSLFFSPLSFSDVIWILLDSSSSPFFGGKFRLFEFSFHFQRSPAG